MPKVSVRATSILASILIVLLTACGKEAVNVSDTTPPFVTSTTPAQGAGGTVLNPAITATFSKAVNPSTVNTTSVTVKGPSGAVAGSVALSGNVMTFTPTTALSMPDAYYTVTISTAVKDLAGNAMQAPYAWTFETYNVPTIVSTSPMQGATGVFVNSPITATFLVDADSANSVMNCSTVTSATFTVSSSAGPISGAVSCTGATATFMPSTPLAQGSMYTATLSAAVQNVQGIGLASAYSWTFSTDSQPSVIATVPVNNATGVLLNQTLSATFSGQMNCATLYAPAVNFTVTEPGGGQVAGKVNCNGNAATFTPDSALAPNTLYTAAISSGAKDTAGQSLTSGIAPNPWTFRTAPAISSPTVIATTPANNAVGVPINQKVAATFSVAMNPATINSSTVKLTGPGGAAVAGTVTYAVTGSIATITPAANLATLTTYVATITTGAQDINGNPLTANYTWTFTTGAAPATTRPTVVSTIPASGATAVPINQAISATFSEAMDPTTITSSSFTLSGPGGTSVTGFVTYAAVGDTATFTPASDLLSGTLYTATVTTGAKDLFGNALFANSVFTFTTAAAPNTTAPKVVLTNPANAAGSVPFNATVNATFSEAMDPLSITTATFTVTGPNNAPVAGTVSYDALSYIATFTPSAALSASTTYTATITNGAADLAGNRLIAGTTANPWTFTTGAAAAVTPVPLGTAALFGSFGGTAGITNQGIKTIINGDIGTTAVSTKVTGFHDNTPGCVYTETPLNIGLVNGSIDTAAPPPTVACPNEGTGSTATIAMQAAADALTAYNQLVAFPNGLDVSVCPGCGGGSAGELGNRVLPPGIYKSAPGSYSISLGPLTLDAQGNPNAFWVFQMSSTLDVGTPTAAESVVLINGAQAKNVFWQVGSAATIEPVLGGGTMQGTIIAKDGIAVSTPNQTQVTTINGRLLSLGASVTMVNTVVNVPAQ